MHVFRYCFVQKFIAFKHHTLRIGVHLEFDLSRPPEVKSDFPPHLKLSIMVCTNYAENVMLFSKSAQSPYILLLSCCTKSIYGYMHAKFGSDPTAGSKMLSFKFKSRLWWTSMVATSSHLLLRTLVVDQAAWLLLAVICYYVPLWWTRLRGCYVPSLVITYPCGGPGCVAATSRYVH